MATAPDTRIVRAACPHDCPDTCAMLVTVENGSATAVRGDPDHPFTRGGLCVKVNNYQDRTNSPDRVLYPMKRSGAKGSGQFERITWDEALGEIKARWTAIIERIRPDRDPALQLSRHRGHPERPERRRPVLQQAGRHRHRADVLRFRARARPIS